MATEVPLRELQRDPDGTAALADRDDVGVQRRDGRIWNCPAVERCAVRVVAAGPPR